MRVRDVLGHKGGGVVTVRPDATCRDLLALLAQHNIGAVVVSPDGITVAGIVSERDVVRRLNDRGGAESGRSARAGGAVPGSPWRPTPARSGPHHRSPGAARPD